MFIVFLKKKKFLVIKKRLKHKRLKQAGQNKVQKYRYEQQKWGKKARRWSESRAVRLGRRQETGEQEVGEKTNGGRATEEQTNTISDQYSISDTNISEEYWSRRTTVVYKLNRKFLFFDQPAVQTFKLHWYKIEKSSKSSYSAAGSWLLTRD